MRGGVTESQQVPELAAREAIEILKHLTCAHMVTYILTSTHLVSQTHLCRHRYITIHRHTNVDTTWIQGYKHIMHTYTHAHLLTHRHTHMHTHLYGHTHMNTHGYMVTLKGTSTVLHTYRDT